jgi:phosphoribosylpyrophosphate synthetase
MPVDNLRASPFLINYIQTKIPDYRNAVIVARNPGQAKRVTAFAERLRLNIAVVHGELDNQLEQSESECHDGRNSPPTLLVPTDCKRLIINSFENAHIT